jgi:hypothetical protein
MNLEQFFISLAIEYIGRWFRSPGEDGTRGAAAAAMKISPFPRLLLRFVAVSVVAAVTTPAATAITILSNNVESSAHNADGSTSTTTFNGTAIPTATVVTATDGPVISTQAISYIEAGGITTLLTTFDQQRGGLARSQAIVSDYSMTFLVDANVSYSLSGAYSVTSGPNVVWFSTVLQDANTAQVMLESTQLSYNTANETFVVGQAGGDEYNSMQGSPTGTLLAGHTYLLIYSAYTYAQFADAGASAQGYVQLQIGGSPTSSVSDGGSMVAMLGIVFVGLAVMRNKRSGPLPLAPDGV